MEKISDWGKDYIAGKTLLIEIKGDDKTERVLNKVQEGNMKAIGVVFMGDSNHQKLIQASKYKDVLEVKYIEMNPILNSIQAQMMPDSIGSGDMVTLTIKIKNDLLTYMSSFLNGTVYNVV